MHCTEHLGRNTVVNVTDTKLTSIDRFDAENYAALALNNDGATSADDTVVTVTGGKITAFDETGTQFNAVSYDADNSKVNISETTIVTGKIIVHVVAITFPNTLDCCLAPVCPVRLLLLLRSIRPLMALSWSRILS